MYFNIVKTRHHASDIKGKLEMRSYDGVISIETIER